jgi:hypothetical protein
MRAAYVALFMCLSAPMVFAQESSSKLSASQAAAGSSAATRSTPSQTKKSAKFRKNIDRKRGAIAQRPAPERHPSELDLPPNLGIGIGL